MYMDFFYLYICLYTTCILGPYRNRVLDLPYGSGSQSVGHDT